ARREWRRADAAPSSAVVARVALWSWLPSSSVILLMGQHVADINLMAVEMDNGDEPVFVSANVEHNEVADFVRRWEGGPHCLKARKIMLLHNFEPPHQRIFAVGVLFPKLA